MKILFFTLLVAILALGFVNYRVETRPQRLFETYFTATPPAGYGSTRTLLATTGENSIYRQAMNYHRQQRYDYALMAWNAYLETEPLPEDHRPQLLAATAALAVGHYAEGWKHLEAMPRETETARANYHWYAALLALRKGDYVTTEELLDDFPLAEATVEWRSEIAELRAVLGRLGNGDTRHEGQHVL